MAAEGKAAKTVRTYTEAVQWFAVAHLLAQVGRTRWDEVGKHDVQRWIGAGMTPPSAPGKTSTSSRPSTPQGTASSSSVRLWTEMCMAIAALDAMREGYEVYPVTDAIAAPRRRPTPVSWVLLAGELLCDWTRKKAPAIAEIVVTGRLLKEQ